MTIAYEDGFGALLDAIDRLGTFHDVISTADRIWDYLEDDGYVIVKSNKQKLTPLDVRQIRSLAKNGATHADIGDRFGVNRATVSRIVKGDYW